MKKSTTTLAFACILTASAAASADEMVEVEADSPAFVATAAPAYLDRMRDVIFYSLSMVGIDYRWGGSTPQNGFDCSGLVMHVFQRMAGLVLPRDSYSMARFGKPVSLKDLRPGDLVFFNTMRRPFSHVGIYLGDKRFVHAPTTGKTVSVVDMTSPYWKARFSGARRIEM